VHTPAEQGGATARLVDDCLQEAAARWAPGREVRFISDTSIVHRWSDAKATAGPGDEPPDP
jgi:DNA polymerase I